MSLLVWASVAFLVWRVFRRMHFKSQGITTIRTRFYRKVQSTTSKSYQIARASSESPQSEISIQSWRCIAQRIAHSRSRFGEAHVSNGYTCLRGHLFRPCAPLVFVCMLPRCCLRSLPPFLANIVACDPHRLTQIFQDKLQTWLASKAISFEERNFDLSNDLVGRGRTPCL